MTKWKSGIVYAEDRMKVVQFLGGKCVRCGFSDHRALQFDHVRGGGLQDIRAQTWRVYHQKILSAPPGEYQLLCANCNWIKRAERNENPGARSVQDMLDRKGVSLEQLKDALDKIRNR